MFEFSLGASAGAGSGEFDIYRGCRRRQMIREAFLTREAKEVSWSIFVEMKIFSYRLIFIFLCRKKPMNNGWQKLRVPRKNVRLKRQRNGKNGKFILRVKIKV